MPRLSLPISLFLIAAATAAAEGPRRIAFREGSAFHQKIEMVQATDSSFNGDKMHNNQTMSFAMRLDVKKVHADGSADIEATYERVAYSMDGLPTGPVEYNSDKPPAEIQPAVAIWDAMRGAKMQLTMMPDGSVSKLDGYQALIERYATSLKTPNDALKKNAIESVKRQFGEDTLKSSFAQTWQVYPAAPAAGDTWTIESLYHAGISMKAANTYTAKPGKDGVAVFEVAGTISEDPAARPRESATSKMTITPTGTRKGTVEVREADGVPLRSTVEQDLKNTLTIESNGTTSKMEMTMKSKTTTEVSDAK